MALPRVVPNPFAPVDDEELPPSRAIASLRRMGVSDQYADIGLKVDEAAAAQRAEDAAGYGQTRRAWNQGMTQLSAAAPAVRGLYRNLTGPEGSGNAALLQAQQMTERAAEYAPDVQSLEDIKGAGDVLPYARNAIVSNLPTMAPTIAAAAATGGGAALLGAGVRKGVQEGVKAGVRAGLRRTLTPTRAAAAGAFVPATALQANQMVPAALDTQGGDTARQRALKAFIGAGGTAALETLPAVQLLSRFGLGGQAKRAVSQSMITRMAREGGGQAATEATTEAIQTFGERATHKWVNDNVELMSADALAEYANAFVAGGLVGGVLGAPAGVRGPQRPDADRVKERLREFSQRGVPKAPADTIEKTGPVAAGTSAPADLFRKNEEVLSSVDDGGKQPPAQTTPAPREPEVDTSLKPGDSAPADQVSEKFDRIFNDLDADDADDGVAKRYDEWRAWRDKPAENRNMLLGPDFGNEPLFHRPMALQLQQSSRQPGKPGEPAKLGLTSTQAVALAALGPDKVGSVSKDAVRAGALYLFNGEYDRADPDLREYLDALPEQKQYQLHEAALHWADVVREARESDRDPPDILKDGIAPLSTERAPVEINEAQGVTETDSLSEASELADLIPNSEMRNIGGDVGRYLDPHTGKLRDGFIPVTDKRGGLKAVSIRAMRTMVSKIPTLAQSFRGPDADVARLVTALSVLKQKGYVVDPATIQPGLVISSKKDGNGLKQPVTLTPLQAKAIRDGLQRPGAVRSGDQMGLPLVGRGQKVATPAATTDQLQLPPNEDQLTDQPEGQFQGDDPRLIPQGRSPNLAPRVDAEGRLTEAEAIDRDSSKDNTRNRQAAERVFNRAVERLAEVTGDTQLRAVQNRTPTNVSQIVENLFSERPGLINSKIGKAYDAALRNLYEYLPELRLPKDKRKSEVINEPHPEDPENRRRIVTRTTVDRAHTIADDGVEPAKVAPAEERPRTPYQEKLGLRLKDKVRNDTNAAETLSSKEELISNIENDVDSPGYYFHRTPAGNVKDIEANGWRSGSLQEGMPVGDEGYGDAILVFHANTAKAPMTSSDGEGAQSFGGQKPLHVIYLNELPRFKATRNYVGARAQEKGDFAEPDFSDEDDRRKTRKDKVRNDTNAEAVGKLVDDVETPGSLEKLQGVVDALSKLLGLPKVVVKAGQRGAFGSYQRGTIRLALSKRKGAAQIDTLLHEYGHHIIDETWNSLPTAHKKAVVEAYKAWRREARQMNTFGDVRASRAPAFIKKWMSSRAGKGQAVPYESLSAGQRKELLSVHEFMADQLAKALSSDPKTRGAVHEFFHKIAEMMRKAYAAATGKRYRPDKSVQDWVTRLIRAEQARLIHSAPTLEEQHELHQAAPAAPTSPPPLTPGQNEPGNSGASPSSLFYALSQEDRGALLRILRGKVVYDQVYAQASPEVQAQLDRYGYDMQVLVDHAAALFAQGRLTVGADLRSPMRRLLDLFKLAVGMPTDRAVAEMILNDYAQGRVRGENGRLYDANARAYRGYYVADPGAPSGKRFVKPNRVAQTVNRFNRSVEKKLGPLYDKLVTDAGTRLREMNNPALAQLAAIFEPRSGEKTKTGGFLQHLERTWQEMMVPYFKATEGLNETEKTLLNRALQRGKRPHARTAGINNILKTAAEVEPGVTPSKAAKVRQLATAYDTLSAYMNNDLFAYSRQELGFKKRANFWPVMIAPDKIRKNRDEFRALLSNPAFEADIRKFFMDAKGKPDTKTPIADLVDSMVLIAETADTTHVGAVDFTDGAISPAFSHERARIMGFMQNLGSDADRKAFAKFQLSSLDAVMVRYTRSLAKRVEFRKAFIYEDEDDAGKPILRNRLDDIIERSRGEGSSKEDRQQAKDFVNMAIGSYKAELNPMVKWAFSKWDALAGTKLADMPVERWASIQQGWMTYQNLRLLPLAAFSSMIDHLGVYVRNGGDFTEAWSSWKDALSAMKKDNPTELRKMAEALGIVEAHALSDALAATYGGSFDPSGVAGRINNMLFKVNGLEAITRYSRLAALAAGHRFLLKHKDTPNEHSVRYLQELGLTAADIAVDPANPNFVVLNDKTKNALYRFVEESVIRPKPTQRPNWHNDPNFMFASQYKGYLYSFWNTVPKRLMTELDNGNTSAALTPLLPYLGVTLMAEMARDFIQDDEEKKEDWGPMDYAAHTITRAGMAGPRFGVINDLKSDVDHGSSALNSWVGPTGQQIGQVTQAALGDRNAYNTFVEAMPLSAIFEDRLKVE